ncbi:Hypothetical protein AA314_06420 [Archangium gephyra]|uniref:Uncharacterized protein n=1 Tax=Archangium gephyra TaxID=48 RepID=A0AAC8QC97_9BACT|nr:Hypothetical protein AA314_06420 [Archangium gephyra]
MEEGLPGQGRDGHDGLCCVRRASPGASCFQAVAPPEGAGPR